MFNTCAKVLKKYLEWSPVSWLTWTKQVLFPDRFYLTMWWISFPNKRRRLQFPACGGPSNNTKIILVYNSVPDQLCWYAASYLKILLSLLMLILSTETLAENIIAEGENMLSFCSSHLSALTNLAWPLSFTPLLSFLYPFGIFTG